ncbi:MAG: aminoacetone oxidase family FAD-binding enzyme [Clostridiales Family XIII bacterium]|jgi:predicted Rossmann fold flavoprotein|nr:aminoacetone oxidase family FAD-binding enzyme [Clostridiales Family XIII bacterium]
MAAAVPVYDAAIIGGGAAGLAAAVSYLRREPHGRLLLIEANDACGKKLLATGSGRCNISNLSANGYISAKSFFQKTGVLFRVEAGGRAYPMSGQAASVRDALVRALENGNAEIRCGTRASRVTRGLAGEAGGTGGFTVVLDGGGDVRARRLLIATGGKAGPQYGCFGGGYTFARRLGHSVESIRPALVPLVYTEKEQQRLAGLKGARVRSRAELFIDGRRAAASSGEMQFTDYGLSGVMMFDLSTMMPKSIIEDRPRTEIAIDLAPGEEAATLERLMRDNEGLWLEGVVGKKLSDLLVRECGGDPARIASLAKNFVARVSGTKGWKEAQATLGGVRVREVDEATGESLLCKGLFFAGEVLEPVYLCGGYNLDYAWATGQRAGAHL